MNESDISVIIQTCRGEVPSNHCRIIVTWPFVFETLISVRLDGKPGKARVKQYECRYPN